MKLNDLKIVTNLTKGVALQVFEIKTDKLISSNVHTGDDALYAQLKDGYGIKVIPADKKSPDSFAYESPEDTYLQIKRLQEKDLDIFPKIYEIDYNKKNQYIYILMEHIHKSNSPNEWYLYDWLPKVDQQYLNRKMDVSLRMLDRCNNIILQSGLLPDTSWFKVGKRNKKYTANFMGNKVVDFHRFMFVPQRYRLPSNGNSVEELAILYQMFLNRYQSMGLQPAKWFRAGIYEGFHFDNGFNFRGYSSDDKEYDSYRKLNFQYLRIVKDRSVLDLGSNQGFFSFQSVIHGAKKVVGVENTIQDYHTAVDINNKIFQYDNIEFIHGDAIKYVMDTKDKFDFVVMNSVFHQLYPHFEGADAFLKKIKNITKGHMIFETPVNHNKMNQNLEQIEKHLKKHFRVARIAYVYDAYSTGYRAIFVCEP